MNIHKLHPGPVVEFSTLTAMFDTLTDKFAGDPRPLLMHKMEGSYRSISYRELRERVDNTAAGCLAMGIQRGDRIAILSENRPEWVISDLAIMKAGAINVSVFPTLTPKQIEFILNDSGAKFVFLSNRLQMNKVVKILPQVPSLQGIVIFTENEENNDIPIISLQEMISTGKNFLIHNPSSLTDISGKITPEDLLTIIYTSGTTGNPKGVMLTHANLASNIRSSAECILFTHTDTVLSFLPLSHSYERMAGYYTAMACGATIAYAESIDTVRENLLEVRPTIVTTVPRLFERIYNRLMKQVSDEPRYRQKIFSWSIAVGKKIVRARRNGSVPIGLRLRCALADRLVFQKIRERTGGRIRFFCSGGAALSKDLGEFFEAIGIQIIEGYGMTESSPVISVNRLDHYKFGTVGPPIPGVTVRIAQDGEILVKGPNVMMGYWNNPSATEEIIDSDGWLHTGDIGTIDDDGFITITDRKKHLFVSSGGKNIAPQHIEGLFLQSPLIDQFVLVGDGRMFLSALIVPSFDVLRDYARANEITYEDVSELVNRPEILAHIEKEMGKIQKDLASHERVRKFTVLTRPLTIENGEMTPTLKIRRKIVEEKFKHIIEQMYEGMG